MNILVDSCSYNCQNVGDLAMLTTAVSRLRELWPSARIQVITNAPDLVAKHCGTVDTVPVRGRRLLLQDHLLGPLHRRLPSPIARRWTGVEDRLRLRRPRLFARSVGWKATLRRASADDTVAFLAALDRADLVVVNGAGILTDAFEENATGILATLEFAVRRGIPTALFGQGIGPIEDPALRRRAAEVLPRVTQIAVRESQSSVPLLRAIGVSPDNVIVTGDDAVEMAFAASRERASTGMTAIGVNVRIAPYAEVEQGTLAALREALGAAARTHLARLIPIPIAHHGGRMDVETLRVLLSDLPGADGSDGGAGLNTPRLVIDRVGECRVMVTGSYHGAVFALAQGIPVVALAKSAYYVNKMAGVAQQFGSGCEIVRLDDAALPSTLAAAIDRAWRNADRVRGPLLEAAGDQIAQGHSAYRPLKDTVLAGEPALAS
jgi:polysaccharide pyruvyl transferase WcaK-like protein